MHSGEKQMAMGTRRRRRRQERLWISHNELAKGPAHPFYKQVNELLETEQFDEFAEKECAKFYAENNGRPSLTPGMYFRLLLVGYFEGKRQRNPPIAREASVMKWRNEKKTSDWERSTAAKPGGSRAVGRRV
jgi:hypothetical protein